MIKSAMLFLLFLVPFTSSASPNLDLIKDFEWKGDCRKVVNEAGEEIKKQPYVRLQSSYSYQGDLLVWWVKSFTDKQCKKIYDGNKYASKCEFTPKDEFAKCKQVSWKSTKDGKTWESEPMVDHAGYPNVSETKVKVKLLKKGKVQLSTIGESEEEEREVLTR